MMAGGPGRVGLLGRVVGPVQVEVGQDDDDDDGGGDGDGRVVGPVQFLEHIMHTYFIRTLILT